MKRNLLTLIALLIALSAFGPAWSQDTTGVQDLSKLSAAAPPMMGIHWARGFNPNFLACEFVLCGQGNLPT